MYRIAGNYLSSNYQFISILLKKCSGANCTSDTLINAKLKNTALSIAVLNSYMDFSDFHTPVKTFFDDRNVMYISPNMSKTIRLFARLNEVNLDDDYLSLKSPINKEFFTLDKTILDINPLSGNTFIDANIFLDYNKDTYKRSVFTKFQN